MMTSGFAVRKVSFVIDMCLIIKDAVFRLLAVSFVAFGL
jgi:hypothetical protein